MPGLGRLRPPVIVAPISVFDGRVDEFLGTRVIERAQLDGDIVATDLFDVSAAKWPNATVPAEEVVPAPGAKLVVAEIAFSGQETEVCWLDDRAPVARLRADGTIAPACACAQIDVRLIAHRATVATAGVCLFHCMGSIGKCSTNRYGYEMIKATPSLLLLLPEQRVKFGARLVGR